MLIHASDRRVELVNLIVPEARRAELKRLSLECPSWALTSRQMCDLELLAVGGFSPLRGFMGQADYESVCERMRLAEGAVWPIPIILDLPEEVAATLEPDSRLALRDPEGVMLAMLAVGEVWKPDRVVEAQRVYGSTDPDHPGVDYVLTKTHPVYVSGALEVVQTPSHYDFVQDRLTPVQLRERFARLGWERIVAFQTRNPMHRAHQELTFRAARDHEACLLVHPVVGMTKPGDVDHYTRVRCYKALMPHYPHGTATMSLLPLAMRMGGPRETVWHAIIRKNYGCTHLIVGRDHAGPGADAEGTPFYGPYDAHELLKGFETELGIEMVPFRMVAYVPSRNEYLPEDEVPEGAETLTLSGTDLRDRLADGREIPAWFSFPEVIRELRRSHPTRSRRGFTVFLTGLPSSGKSTVANVLRVKLLESGGRPVTLLDGDIVRKNLSSELTFSKAHRDLNIRRIGFVASEITKNGGIAICAPIAPYDAVRKEVRAQIGSVGGGFALVHVATPLETCELRDRKGLYAKARAGIVKEFTGISDPYEEPADAEVAFDTTDLTPEECAQWIILYLEKEGYIGTPDRANT